MWKISLLTLTLLLVIKVQDSTSSPSPLIYSAVSSKLITSNSVYKILIFVEDVKDRSSSSSSLEFSAKINSTTETLTSSSISVIPGTSGTLEIPTDELNSSKYNLTLSVKDSEGKEWTNETTLFTTKKDRSILLHTDKSIYKPGETVRFRVVLLNRELRPFGTDQVVEVKILDPQRNIIKIWERARLRAGGLFKSKLELSTEPVLGDWKIEVKSVQMIKKSKHQIME